MVEALAPLLADGVIEAVISRLKSGKEADIFIVQHAGEVVAAKVYKERHARNFRNNAVYKEGRQVRNTRTQRAMEKGTRFGQEASEDAWKSMEVDALTKLHAAGCRVPQPIVFYEGVLLMELVIDATGHPAPRLIDAHVPKEVAAPFYADLRSQVVKMLRCDLIHGDLSPYNVMLAWNGPTIIDFPQVIGAAHNRQAEFFLQRDLQTLQQFFSEIDPSLRTRAGDAREIWRAYEKGELTDDFVPTGKLPPDPRPAPRREFQPGQASGAPAARRPEGGRGPLQGGGAEGRGRGPSGRPFDPRGGRAPGPELRNGGADLQSGRARGPGPGGKPGEPRRDAQPRRARDGGAELQPREARRDPPREARVDPPREPRSGGPPPPQAGAQRNGRPGEGGSGTSTLERGGRPRRSRPPRGERGAQRWQGSGQPDAGSPAPPRPPPPPRESRGAFPSAAAPQGSPAARGPQGSGNRDRSGGGRGGPERGNRRGQELPQRGFNDRPDRNPGRGRHEPRPGPQISYRGGPAPGGGTPDRED